MSKRECDIIKDLLPSYVDEICSEASKEWIEEHLKGCGDCKRTAEMLKNTEISAKRLELESLDAGRKVIRQNLRRSVWNLGLCLLMAYLIFFVLEFSSVQIPQVALDIALPICMLMTWLTFRNQSKMRRWDKWDTVMAVVAVFIAGYGVAMMWYGFFCCAAAGETVFGLELNEVGPFLHGQMVLAAVTCFLIYVLQVVRTVKKGRVNSLVLHLCLTGIFLMMTYCTHTGQLSDLNIALEQLKDATFTVLFIGLWCTIVYAFIDKWTNKYPGRSL